MISDSSLLEGSGGDGVRSITAADVARTVGGRLVGDGDVRISSLAPLDSASSSALSFLASPRYADAFSSSKAAAVLVPPALADTPGGPATRIIVERPHEAMLAVIAVLHPGKQESPAVDPSAKIGAGATLGAGVIIGPLVVIGAGAVIGDNVTIGAACVIGEGAAVGAGSRLWPAVTLYPGAVLGRRVKIHSGARIGSDGFGYVHREGVHEKIPHVGGCVLGDDVEIGANTTIDRGSIGDTVVGPGSKIDNLVQVGHNVRIGSGCMIVAQAGISGSTAIGDGVVIGGQAGIAGHITIGARARIAGQSGVFGDVPAGESWSGYPARPHRESLRASAALFKLAGLMKRVERLLGSDH